MEINNITQRSEEWFELRKGRVTSSAVASIMAARGLGKAAHDYAYQLLLSDLMEFEEEQFVSTAMQYGIDTEPIAREAYEMETFTTVREIAFFTKGDNQGSSPDGMVGENGLLEIKCPQAKNHLNYFMSDTCPKEYYDQIQHQMYVTGRTWCDFVSFNHYFKKEYQLKIIRVEVDLKWQEKWEARFIEFQTILTELKEKIKCI